MEFINEVKALLLKCLENTSDSRAIYIYELQNKIWNDELVKDKELNEIISTLAYDLDFYEPDEELRKEDPSYYGDERFEEIIKIALEKLKEC